ncbi:DUF6994 family protein [Arenicella xantha]|uniref:Uncharacterized protein n=1 Tax=Arenicella xantha TaxID=644221 RepID=A0A395JMT2_9GAMM|nr:hypothetical protein [Arenicella xantha]RBP52974.1 hypothetical protein DFR28_101358 [Arenicella xantha]
MPRHQFVFDSNFNIAPVYSPTCNAKKSNTDLTLRIDTHFDYWADISPGLSIWDAKGSRDPDSSSKPLQATHQLLWTKRLPNGARGMLSKISVRMDLTLETIRRHYVGEVSPMTDVLERYSDFFELFVDFAQYVDFWLLNDLADDQYQVRFFLPFDGFQRNATPANVNEYIQLKHATVEFLSARNARIAEQVFA